MRGRPVFNAAVIASSPLFVSGVLADIANKEIQQTVIIEIEEDRSSRVTYIVQTGLMGDVAKFAAPKIFKQDVSASNCSDKQVRVAIVIDVGKRSSDTDLVFHSNAGSSGDVFKF